MESAPVLPLSETATTDSKEYRTGIAPTPKSKKRSLNVPFNVTCHSLRHSFASHLNDEEVDILVIQDLLGHATPRKTADYYIHPSEKKVRQALEKLSGVIYMNQLVQSGLIKFQSNYQKRE